MPKYAILADNKIINVIVADSLEIAKEFGNVVEYPTNINVGIGGYYNKENNEFSNTLFEESAEIN